MSEPKGITWEELKLLASEQRCIAAVNEATKTLYVYRPIVFDTNGVIFDSTHGFSIYQV